MLEFFQRYRKQIAGIVLTSIVGTVVGAVMAATGWVTIPVGWAALYGFGFSFSLSTLAASISCCCCRDDSVDDEIHSPPFTPPGGSPHTYLPGDDGLDPRLAAQFMVAADHLQHGGFLPQDIDKLKEGLKRRSARMNPADSAIYDAFYAARQHRQNINDYFEAIARICGLILIKLMHANEPRTSHESKQEFPKNWKPNQREWQQYKKDNKKENAKDFNHRPQFTEIRVRDPNVNRFILVEHKNPYEILGVAIDASSQEIEKAFRKMIVKFHPDKAENLTDAQKGQNALAAIDLLRNPTTRKEVNHLLSNAQPIAFDYSSLSAYNASHEPSRQQTAMNMNSN